MAKPYCEAYGHMLGWSFATTTVAVGSSLLASHFTHPVHGTFPIQHTPCCVFLLNYGSSSQHMLHTVNKRKKHTSIWTKWSVFKNSNVLFYNNIWP